MTLSIQDPHGFYEFAGGDSNVLHDEYNSVELWLNCTSREAVRNYVENVGQHLRLFIFGSMEHRFYLDKMVTMCITIRDFHHGHGRKDLCRWMLLELEAVVPTFATSFLELLIRVGYWKDVFMLLQDIHYSGGEVYAELEEDIYAFVEKQFRADMDAHQQGRVNDISLLSKYIPKERKAIDRTTKFVRKFVKRMYPDQTEVCFAWAMEAYRKDYRALKKHLDIVEDKMCNGNWSEIEFNYKVPLNCKLRNHNAFLNCKNDVNRLKNCDTDRIACRLHYIESDSSIPPSISPKTDYTEELQIFNAKMYNLPLSNPELNANANEWTPMDIDQGNSYPVPPIYDFTLPTITDTPLFTELKGIQHETPLYPSSESTCTFQEPSFTFQEPSFTFPEQSFTFPEPSVTFPEPSVTFPEPSVTFQEPSFTFQEPSVTFQEPSFTFQDTPFIHQEPTVTFTETPIFTHQEPTFTLQPPTFTYKDPTVPDTPRFNTDEFNNWNGFTDWGKELHMNNVIPEFNNIWNDPLASKRSDQLWSNASMKDTRFIDLENGLFNTIDYTIPEQIPVSMTIEKPTDELELIDIDISDLTDDDMPELIKYDTPELSEDDIPELIDEDEISDQVEHINITLVEELHQALAELQTMRNSLESKKVDEYIHEEENIAYERHLREQEQPAHEHLELEKNYADAEEQRIKHDIEECEYIEAERNLRKKEYYDWELETNRVAEYQQILVSMCEKIEQERIEQERIEQERIEQERIEQERIEQERIEQERIEQERIAQWNIEQDRIEQWNIELERIDNARLDHELVEKNLAASTIFKYYKQWKLHQIIKSIADERAKVNEITRTLAGMTITKYFRKWKDYIRVKDEEEFDFVEESECGEV